MDTQKLSRPSPQFQLLDSDSFYIGRVLANVALVKVGAVSDLHAAKSLMRRVAARIPGAYVIFHGGTRRVVGKLESHARA